MSVGQNPISFASRNYPRRSVLTGFVGRAALLMAVLIVGSFNAAAKPPPAKAPASVTAVAPVLADVKLLPPDINLSSKQDKQSLVVQVTYSDGTTRDVTEKASLTLKDKTIAKLDKNTL